MRGWNKRGVALVTIGLGLGSLGTILLARVICGSGGGAPVPTPETVRATQDLDALERLYQEHIIPLREASLRNREQLDALLSDLELGLGWSESNQAPATSSTGQPSRFGLNREAQEKNLLKVLEHARIWGGAVRRDDGRHRRDSTDRTERADLGR